MQWRTRFPYISKHIEETSTWYNFIPKLCRNCVESAVLDDFFLRPHLRPVNEGGEGIVHNAWKCYALAFKVSRE